MSNSLRNILLSEDTGEELKKKGYIKISDAKKDEYEKKGCKVVRSDNQTYYAKCQSSNDNNNQQVVVTLNCPPNEDIAPFQKWLNDNNKPWYQGGKFNGTLGNCGNATKQAWANNEWKNGYLSSKSSGTGGGNVPSQSTPLDSRGYNPQVVEFAKQVKFYDNDNRLFKSLSYIDNDNFENDREVLMALNRATKRVNNGESPVIAYISAVNSVLDDRGQSFAFIYVPSKYQNELPKDTIIENYLKLNPTIGLVNLLLNEQPGYVTISVDKDEDGRKTIGDIVKTTKKNIKFTCDLAEPIIYKEAFPIEAPIIKMIKDRLEDLGVEVSYAVGEGEIFDKTLRDVIVSYRNKNSIPFDRKPEYIDTPLLKAIFPQCKGREQASTGTKQTVTAPQQTQTSFSLNNFGFRQILDRAASILNSLERNQEIYYKDCEYIFSEYPNVANNAKLSLSAIPSSRRPNIDENNADLKKIKESITACAVRRKGRTKLAMTSDVLNIFKKGLKSITNLDIPWRMTEKEIFGQSMSVDVAADEISKTETTSTQQTAPVAKKEYKEGEVVKLDNSKYKKINGVWKKLSGKGFVDITDQEKTKLDNTFNTVK